MKLAINKIYKRRAAKYIATAFGALSFVVLIIMAKRLSGSDDTNFLLQVKPFGNVWEWVSFRYQNWSGRIFAESFVYIFSQANLIYWKIISLVMYGLSVLYMYLIYKLWDEKPTDRKKLYMISIISVMLLLLGHDVLYFGVLWVTGGMTYFWMASLGLAGIYPMLHYFKHKILPRWWITVLGILSTIIVASSQEQIGITMLAVILFIAVSIIYTRYSTSKKISVPIFVIIYLCIVAISLISSIIAPGNELRYKAEIANWLPDFLNISLKNHIEYGYRWFLEGFINHTGVILALIMACYSMLFVKLKTNKSRNSFLSIVFMVSSILLLSKGHEATNFLFNYNAVWHFIPYKFSYISVLLWSLILLISASAPILLYANKAKGWLLSILFALSMATALIMVASPTMYASGWRVIFVPSYILLIMFVLLVSDVLNKYQKYSAYILSVIYLFAISQFINTLYYLHKMY